MTWTAWRRGGRATVGVYALAGAVALLAVAPAAADEPKANEPKPGEPTADASEAGASQSPDANDPVERARALYVEGVALVKATQWAEALAAFERSAKLHANATTTFNIGFCERALGRYVRARATLARALAEDDAAASKMADSTRQEATGYVDEIDRLLARATVTLVPKEAAVAVDGRPLAVQVGQDKSTLLAAGVEAPGPGRPAPGGTFEVLLDPGVHVFTLSRKGFSDVVLNRTFAPGAHETMTIELDELPATLKVISSEKGALVVVNERDVGPAPVDVKRPPGTYRVVVSKEGFIPYESQVSVKAGEELKLRASLAVDEPSVLERWWFWAGAAAVIGAGVVITYAVTRPEPEPPPYDGGTTGWVVEP